MTALPYATAKPLGHGPYLLKIVGCISHFSPIHLYKERGDWCLFLNCRSPRTVLEHQLFMRNNSSKFPVSCIGDNSIHLAATYNQEMYFKKMTKINPREGNQCCAVLWFFADIQVYHTQCCKGMFTELLENWHFNSQKVKQWEHFLKDFQVLSLVAFA